MPKLVFELAMDNGMKQIWILLLQSLKKTFSFLHWLLFTFRAMSVYIIKQGGQYADFGD